MLNHEPECQSIFLVKFHPKYFENGPGGRVKNRTSLTETRVNRLSVWGRVKKLHGEGGFPSLSSDFAITETECWSL